MPVKQNRPRSSVQYPHDYYTKQEVQRRTDFSVRTYVLKANLTCTPVTATNGLPAYHIDTWMKAYPELVTYNFPNLEEHEL